MITSYQIYKKGKLIKECYTGDDALQFIDDNNYKIYTMYEGGHDTFIIELKSKMQVIKCQDLFPSNFTNYKTGDELEINGELYYTLDQIKTYGYNYAKEWVKEIDY